MIPNSLNDAQRQAVEAPLRHQLVLAGAGSGKTRVLIHRIAWLVDKEGLSPFEVLAVTFTNKAANEMRMRLESLLKFPTKQLWIGTFHGLSHRLLRAHHAEAGLPAMFQIMDSDDQLRLVKRTIQALNLDEDRFPPKEAQWFINHQKEEGLEPHEVQPFDAKGDQLARIYTAYQAACQKAGAIDFADLLLKSYKLLLKNDELRAHYQSRFRALLVDEFQDTNTIQYAWLKLLAGLKSAVMIVGDDDQSIYGWRGARVENIQRFSTDFANAAIIRLEQNYRSTSTILTAANTLIAQNSGRMGKNLWTTESGGEPITVYAGFNDQDEAYFVVSRIRELKQSGNAFKQMAILYRSNAQSRVLEEILMQFGIPYRVYGGLRFFDRAEIKDALAYLRLIMNRADDTAFERIINTPPRGIGDRTLVTVRDYAKANNMTLWDALKTLLDGKQFSARSETALLHFVKLIEQLSDDILTLTLQKQTETVIAKSGLIEHFRKEKGEKGLTRIENLEELINAAHQFSQEVQEENVTPLSAFLASAALESSAEQANPEEDSVQLMTLHSAKGLEFPFVFLVGCEEELFPHYLSMHDPKALEEERRLCYVGMTRAMQKLFMTYAESRRLHGKEVYHRPSRFLDELPQELVQGVKFRTKVKRPMLTNDAPVRKEKMQESKKGSGQFYPGQTVHHRTFGEGTILQLEGDGDDLKIKIRFKQVGTKTLMANFVTVA